MGKRNTNLISVRLGVNKNNVLTFQRYTSDNSINATNQ